MMTAIIANDKAPPLQSPWLRVNSTPYAWCQIKPNRFIIPFDPPSVICPLNWLQSKVWIDWARVNWPQFLVPQAFRQGARLPSWCLIQGPRWRRNSLAVRSLTHTLTRRGCGSGWPRGMRGSGVWAAPPALKSQYNRGQWCDSELCALKWMDRCFLLRAMVKPTITV